MKRWSFGILLVLWGGGVTLAIGALMALHGVSFFPDRGLAAVSGQNQWAMTHVLGEGCKCSHQVYLYLLRRGPQVGVQETVIVLGEMNEEKVQLRARGFAVDERSPAALSTERAVGVPFLLIHSDKGDTVYAGGYATSVIRESTALLDLDILESLRGGKMMAELPVFGCAVSQKMKNLIDPFRLKYKEPAL